MATRLVLPEPPPFQCKDLRPRADDPNVTPAAILHGTEDDALARDLARILSTHGPSIRRVAALYARGDPDDLLQEIAVALWRALPSFRRECSERTFVLRVAHNRAVSHLASAVRRTHEDLEGVDVAASTGRNPAIVYERTETRDRLLSAVRGLPLGARQVLGLLLEDLSYAEIAAVLGLTEGNVAVRITRARQALRILLERQE
jgi:RNA polymerase sigma-70 factor (ECF subfamily)